MFLQQFVTPLTKCVLINIFLSLFDTPSTKSEGIISTDWLRTHKGEVKLKVICSVEGKSYQIIVIQKLLFSESDNTPSANLCKNKLKEEIEKKIIDP